MLNAEDRNQILSDHQFVVGIMDSLEKIEGYRPRHIEIRVPTMVLKVEKDD